MAKTCVIERELKRERLVKKYAAKRAAYKAIVLSPTASQDEKWAAIAGLQALPKNSTPCRLRNRCQLTGRGHGVYRKFGLGRSKLRDHAMFGEIPGLVKASW